jgi:hypothetical protein
MKPRSINRSSTNKIVFVLLLCLTANIFHLLSHFYTQTHIKPLGVLALSREEGKEQTQTSFNNYHNCLACQSFQHNSSQQSFYISFKPPLAVIVTLEHEFKSITAILAKSHFERGPPRA